MAVISGVLKGPMGDALEGVVIELRALRTSATVITQERSSSVTSATGRYSLTVEPGDYSVFISAFGRTPENRGSISVKVNSATGTLNDFLLIPGETDLNPAIVATVDGMRAAAAASAAAAKTSENNASAAMTNALSKVATAEQKVAGQVTFSKQTGLTTTSTPAFNPSSQGFWTGWNRVNTGASELINHKGEIGTGGGFNFYETDGSTIKRTGALSPNGFWTTTGGLSSVGDQVMDANATNANVLIRFRNQAGIENSAIYAQTDTGQLNIRWGGTAYSMSCKPDGTVTFPNTIYIGSTPVLKAGEYGIGGGAVTFSGNIDDNTLASGNYYANSSATGTKPESSYGHLTVSRESTSGASVRQMWTGNSNFNLWVRAYVNGGWSAWAKTWNSLITTVDSNGFIKKASPIVKLFADGSSELNGESQGVTTERVSEGVYRISGTLGFNADAEWGGVDGGIEIPTDRNKLPLVWVDYEVDETGDLLIKTFHRVNSTAPKIAQNVKVGYKEGQPIDIPAGRWIDLRVEMPAGDEPEYIPEPEPEVTPDPIPVEELPQELENVEQLASGEMPAPIEEPKE